MSVAGRIRWALGGLLCALLVATGCVRAPAARLEPPLTAAVFPFALDTFRTVTVRPGVEHRFLYAPAGPWAIHVLDVQLDRCFSAVAVKGGPDAVGRTKTSELMRGLSGMHDVVGGVNADFFLFDPPGVPTGALVSRGRVITPPSAQPALAMDSAGVPHIGVFTLRGGGALKAGDPALAGAALDPFHPMEAVGGRPLLARDSVIAAAVDTEGQPGFADGRHPRTAVGIGRDGKRLMLVVVDGRQPAYSAGMTLRELAVVMLALGAPDAINLDGGGSTTFVFADPAQGGALRIGNRPSDPTGERPVGDALAIVAGCASGRR